MVIFLVSGLWHGANWTFIAWGAYHALLFAPLLLQDKNRKYTGVVDENRILPSLGELLQMAVTFALVVVGWIIFRAESIRQAWDYMCGICSPSLFSMPYVGRKALLFSVILIAVEWFGRKNQFALQLMPRSTWVRVLIYWTIAGVIILGGAFGDNQFIYFQF